MLEAMRRIADALERIVAHLERTPRGRQRDATPTMRPTELDRARAAKYARDLGLKEKS